MAAGMRFVCTHCAHAISAWDEGNPYYRDARGRKRYAFHPDPARERCTGLETPVLCLACGAERTSDSADPLTRCPACAADALCDTWALHGRTCPHCREGTFEIDPSGYMIS